jgi:hypothetical protein
VLTLVGTTHNSSRALRRAFKADNTPPTYSALVPMRNERAKPLPATEMTLVEVMLPSDFLHWMWTSHPIQFRDRVLGSPTALASFWSHIKDGDSLWRHPGLSSRENLHLCIPWAVHGDGVPFRKLGAGSTSLQTISFGSLSGTGPTADTHFLYCGIPGDVLVKTERRKGNRTTEPLWEILVWDLKSCLDGRFATHDHTGCL